MRVGERRAFRSVRFLVVERVVWEWDCLIIALVLGICVGFDGGLEVV